MISAKIISASGGPIFVRLRPAPSWQRVKISARLGSKHTQQLQAIIWELWRNGNNNISEGLDGAQIFT
jgi:hypothetical protein